MRKRTRKRRMMEYIDVKEKRINKNKEKMKQDNNKKKQEKKD
jgi:hypothetical protein